MSFPEDFLKQLEPYAELSPQQEKVFLEIFARGKSRVEVTQVLHMSESNLNSCFSGIYNQFYIGGRGPGKESRLREYLSQRYQGWKPSNYSNIDEENNNIDALVQEIRKQIKPSIKQRCGTMRVLDMEQPIELTGKRGIYTNVNILEKINGRRRLDITELLRNCDVENFNRFGLNGVKEERVLGIEAVKRYRKLMVFGKPGAGKTTFLKYLAMQCIEGNFLQEYVPIFITLKDFAEAGGKPNLLTYICQTIHVKIDVLSIQEIIQKGCVFILLDGLDEVKEEDTKRVLRHIRDFSDQFHTNKFVITCRIAAKEYTFESFTEIEVADFDKEQIAIFAQKWFRAKNDLVKAGNFIKKLEKNKPIFELATNPLLLTLLCLVFGEAGNFPENRSELYEEGLDVLLKKWDGKRNIERDVVYKNLSLQRKEDLLSQIALTTFENKDYFFKHKIVEGYIADFIYNLPNARLEPEELELDSEAVLKSIESQHGLLVERARGIYSFSHLTFQEYFTARKIVKTQNSASLEILIENITDKRWREVFLLTMEMLPSADGLVRLMKWKIDELIAEEEKLQKFFEWIYEKAKSVNTPYKTVAVRAFYAFEFDLIRPFDHNFSWVIAYHYEPSVDPDFEKGYEDWLLELEEKAGNNVYKSSDYSALNRTSNTKDKNYFHDDLALYLDLDQTLNLNLDYISCDTLLVSIDSMISHALNSELRQNLQNIRAQLLHFLLESSENWEQWLQGNYQLWTQTLRGIMIEHCNIGHDWQFTDTQKQLLQDYYDANKLLVDCLNRDCYVSREVRQEIEDTLLLPMSEIKQRKEIQ